MTDFFKQKRIPADNCVFCDKPILEVGGRRLVADGLCAVDLSNRYWGGGNKNYPYYSVKLFDHQEIYLVVKGKKKKWTAEAIERAKTAYLTGKHPWFCQWCGYTQCCHVCNSPINIPRGAEVLYDDGRILHAPMHPFNPGCSNQECNNYKEFPVRKK